jgi:hypothetical protein
MPRFRAADLTSAFRRSAPGLNHWLRIPGSYPGRRASRRAAFTSFCRARNSFTFIVF